MDGMVECCIMTMDEYLRKDVSAQQRDWDKKPHFFLLIYKCVNHKTTGMMPASVVVRRELCLPCNLLFGAPPPGKARATRDYLRDLMEQLHETDHFACQHLKVATGWSAMTAQPTQLDSRKRPGLAVLPKQRELA
jgi:hypothetical protein